MKFGLSEKTIQKISNVFAAHPQIEKAVIFGSRAKGNYKNGSDIDLTLHGKDLTAKLLREIETELDDLLLPYKMDVSIFDQISNPEFIGHILRVGLVFYEKKRLGEDKSGGKKRADSWKVEKLGDVCENLDSQRIPVTQRDRKSGEYPYYGASGIVDYVDKYIFDEDLLLVSEDGANLLARTYPIAFSVSGKIWVNNHAHVLRFENIISQRFVEYYLNSISLEKYVNGMAQPKLNQAMLNSIPVPYPSLAEQQRIVALLDENFAALTKVHATAERNRVNAKEVFESVLHNALRSQGWEEKKLGDVCTEIFAGGDVPKNSFSKIKTDKYPTPIFTNGEKNKGLYGYTDVARVTVPSITISARGTIGYSEIREEAFYPAIRLIVVVPDKSLLDLSFLQYAISSMNFSHSGTSIPQLTVPMVREHSIPLPPLAEQISIARQLDALAAETNRLEEVYQSKVDTVEELRKSILQKAFEGGL